MIPQLLIVGGAGGAGSSTWAARLADSLAATGAQVGIASIDPRFGADRLVTHAGCTPVQIDSHVPEQIAAAADAWRIDPVATARVLDDLTRRGLPVLWRLPEFIAQYDHLVLDLGSSLGRALLGAHQLRWYLDELGPLNAGWLRATRPVTALAMGSSVIGKVGSRQLAAVTARVDALIDLMTCDRAAVLLAHGAGARASEKARWHAASASLAQARVGAVLDGSQSAEGALQSRLGHSDIPVWTELTADWMNRLAGPQPSISIDGDARAESDVSWRMPLPFNDFDEVEVEQAGRRLIIGVHGEQRTFALPSSMQRYWASAASLRTGILEVTFSPIPQEQPRRSTT